MILHLLLFVLTWRVDWAEKVLEVMSLNSTDFEETLRIQERVFVDFYAPWCGHCQALEPEFKKAANDARAEDIETVFAMVDATANGDLAKQYQVTSFPTLLLFYNGEKEATYNGARKAKPMLNWVRKHEDPTITELDEGGVETFLQETSEGEFTVVARVKKGSVRGKAFEKAAEAFSEYEVSTVHFGVEWLSKTADPKNDAILMMQRPGFVSPDPDRLTYQGAWSDDAIVTWVKNGTYPTIGDRFETKKYKPAEIELLGGGSNGSVVVLLDDSAAISEEDKLKTKMREVVMSLTSSYRHWRFTFADYAELVGREAEILGSKGSYNALITVLQGQRRWVLEGEDKVQNLDTVRNFLDGVIAKKVKPRHRSQLPPEFITDEYGVMVDPEGVSILTGDTFEEIALNATKDVFVFFYGPDCPHSREMAPEWAKLADRASKSWRTRGVVVAKMDATGNTCEEEVTGFPKLVLYPAVKAAKKFKQRQLYRGKRTLDAMAEFLLENARNLEAIRDDEGAGMKSKGAFSMVDREIEKKKKKQEL